MSTKELVDSAVEHLRSTASVKTVYGEPVVVDGKTIIPVARVAYGFGGGSGAAPASDSASGNESAVEAPGGAGGGMSAKPIGVVEVTAQETKFVPFGQTKRIAMTALIASAVGLGLGFLFRRKER